LFIVTSSLSMTVDMTYDMRVQYHRYDLHAQPSETYQLVHLHTSVVCTTLVACYMYDPVMVDVLLMKTADEISL